MKKFKFKLETVLSERKRVEDMRLKDFTLVQRMLLDLQDQLAALKRRLSEAFDETTALASQDSGNVGLFQSMESFIAGTKKKIEWKTREIERGSKLVEKARLLYVAARQKREALEKLRERKLKEFNDLLRKQELKKLDDIYIMNGAARRRMDEEETNA